MKTILEKLAALKDPQALVGGGEWEGKTERQRKKKEKEKRNEGNKPAVMLNVLGRDLPQWFAGLFWES